MALPRVSIVTPSLNQGAFLRDNLESVAAQRGAEVEHILIDGGSTDETAKVVEACGGHLAYRQSRPDGGQTDALIQGFARATGEIFGWLNADDYLWDGAAMRRVAEAFAARPDADLVTGDLVYVAPDRSPVMMDMVWRPTERQLRYYMALSQPSTFWRRRAYERAGGLDPSFHFCMDFDLFQRMSRGGPIARIPHILAAFRLQRASKTYRLRETLREEEARCRMNALGRPTPGLAGKVVNLGIRAGAALAEAQAILSGRKLPSYMNVRLEPCRWRALKSRGLEP